MAAVRHTHKYEKAQVGGSKLWRCALGGKCTHYLPRHLEALIVGRMSICWDCEREFELTAGLAAAHDKPICADCSGLTAIAENFDNVMAAIAAKNHG